MYKLRYSIEEEDWFTEWRRVLHWKAGQGKKIKRRYHKKMRRDARKVILEQLSHKTP